MIEVRLLGDCQILVNHRAIQMQKTKIGKPWQIFCRLASGIHNWVSADILMEEFWPNKEYEKANNSLKNAVLLLRDDLRQITGLDCDSCIESRNGGYQINQSVEVKADIADFYHLYCRLHSEKRLDMSIHLESFWKLVRIYKGGLVFRTNQDNWISRYAEYLSKLFEASIERCFTELSDQGMYREIVSFYEELTLDGRVSDEITRYWHRALKTLDTDGELPSYGSVQGNDDQEPRLDFCQSSLRKSIMQQIKQELSQQEKSPLYISEYSELVRYCTSKLPRYSLTLFSFEPVTPKQTNLEEYIDLFKRLAITALRGNDIVAQYSDDSVLVVLPNHSAGSSAVVRRRLCKLFTKQQKNVLIHADITTIGHW